MDLRQAIDLLHEELSADYIKYDQILITEKSTEILVTAPLPKIFIRDSDGVRLLPRPKVCVGYRVKTIPNLIGETEWYIPALSNKLFEIKKAMYQEFKEKYEKYKKRYMWRTILTLYQIKHQTTVVSCGQTYTSNGIPFELCHKIWEFQ